MFGDQLASVGARGPAPNVWAIIRSAIFFVDAAALIIVSIVSFGNTDLI